MTDFLNEFVKKEGKQLVCKWINLESMFEYMDENMSELMDE